MFLCNIGFIVLVAYQGCLRECSFIFRELGAKAAMFVVLGGKGGGVPKEKHYRQLERKVNFMSGTREL